jgi:hypothetical protein
MHTRQQKHIAIMKEYISDQIILAKLAEAEKEAADPNTKWLTQDEVFAPIRERP